MPKILVPVDRSPNADQAVAQLVEFARNGVAVDVHLLNVQIPIDGHARTFVGQDDVDTYHRGRAWRL